MAFLWSCVTKGGAMPAAAALRLQSSLVLKRSCHLFRHCVIPLRIFPLSGTRQFHNRDVDNLLLGTKNQVYSIPTIDSAFKWILSSDEVRLSFFNVFIPNLTITSSKRIDEHMHPTQSLQLLRHFIHDSGTSKIVSSLSSSDAFVARSPQGKAGPQTRDHSATAFLKNIVRYFGDIKRSFPLSSYGGKLDFACQLSNGEYALVEMQVIPHNHFDRRGLVYGASVYVNQLKQGQDWSDIKKVYAINILGGGQRNSRAWSNAPGQYMRHYKFEDQLNGKGRFIEGIEIIQYSIMNAPIVDNQEHNDWIAFLKGAQFMTEDDVAAQIKTPAVLKAFERAKISSLPATTLKMYENEKEQYDNYSRHTAELLAEERKEGKIAGKIEGKIEGKIDVARHMIRDGFPMDYVSKYTGFSSEDLKDIN